MYFWLTPQNCDRLQKALKIFKLLAVSCSLKTFRPKFVPKSFKQHKIAFFWRPLALSLNRIFYLKSFLKNKDGIRRWMSWRFFEHCRIGEVFYSWWVLYLVLIECDKNCANLSFKKTRSIVEIFLCSLTTLFISYCIRIAWLCFLMLFMTKYPFPSTLAMFLTCRACVSIQKVFLFSVDAFHPSKKRSRRTVFEK